VRVLRRQAAQLERETAGVLGEVLQTLDGHGPITINRGAKGNVEPDLDRA
jgi:hypothetical protein